MEIIINLYFFILIFPIFLDFDLKMNKINKIIIITITNLIIQSFLHNLIKDSLNKDIDILIN